MDPDEVIQKIEDVEIQGATSVARAGVELLQSLEGEGRGQAELAAVEERLREERPTEPLLFNALDAADVMGYDAVLDHIEEAQAAVTGHGRDLVNEGDTIYTHCHSSTVTALLRDAADTEFAVHVTETRPLYQGRTTAEELADADIPVTLYVDAGARLALEDTDAMFIGADAVTGDGAVVNKIGSGMIAETAAARDIPVYVFADSWKLADEMTVERRGAAEVWAGAPEGVEVANPAFERVSPEHITAIVSELGRHQPNTFMAAARDAYPEVL
ncbi:MAG: hypothetical protein SVW77_00425 [Candidatus Nanohaloarchaea archaeon]|nr:hypothetical protein [Candidatus Nanohaloarchaea archaeon]